jgi:hypothetical protein
MGGCPAKGYYLRSTELVLEAHRQQLIDADKPITHLPPLPQNKEEFPQMSRKVYRYEFTVRLTGIGDNPG